MNFEEYAKAAGRTGRADKDIVNGALGLAGEAGEVVELIKKHRYHGRDLDTDALCKELGDVLWYVAETARCAGISLDDVATANDAKLRARYPDGFKEGGGVRDVLEGFEWKADDYGDMCLFPPDPHGDSDYIAIAHTKLWTAWESPTSGYILTRGRSDDPKAAAEAALRAHLEAQAKPDVLEGFEWVRGYDGAERMHPTGLPRWGLVVDSMGWEMTAAASPRKSGPEIGSEGKASAKAALRTYLEGQQ